MKRYLMTAGCTLLLSQAAAFAQAPAARGRIEGIVLQAGSASPQLARVFRS